MNTIKFKTVAIRKTHQCFGCRRIFPTKTQMNYWAVAEGSDFLSGYTCETCQKIYDIVEDGEGMPEGFVSDELEKGQTPEDLLEELLKNQNNER